MTTAEQALAAALTLVAAFAVLQAYAAQQAEQPPAEEEPPVVVPPEGDPPHEGEPEPPAEEEPPHEEGPPVEEPPHEEPPHEEEPEPPPSEEEPPTEEEPEQPPEEDPEPDAPPAEEPPVEQPQPPASEGDSPEGWTIAPGGQTITYGGIRYRIGTDGKIYKNDVVLAWSGGVDEMFIFNGKLYQHAVWGGTWAGDGFFEVRPDAEPTGDPRLVVPEAPNPNPVPAPAGMKDFSGEVIAKDQWGNTWAPSYWQNNASILAWNPDNVKVVGSEVRLKLNPKGAAEIQTNNSEFFKDGRASMLATTPRPVSGLIVAPLWLYDQTNGEEIDIELVGTKGAQLAIHGHGQWNIFVRLIPGDFTGQHLWAIDYKAGQYVRWYCDGNLLATATPADFPAGAVFPHLQLKPLSDIWSTHNAGWAGQWVDPQPEITLTLHAYGLVKNA